MNIADNFGYIIIALFTLVGFAWLVMEAGQVVLWALGFVVVGWGWLFYGLDGKQRVWVHVLFFIACVVTASNAGMFQ